MLDRYYETLQDIYRLSSIKGLLDWDHQVNLPPLGADERGEQLKLMSTLIHQKLTSPEFVALVEKLRHRTDLSPEDEVNVRESWRKIDRSRKLPDSFVAERSRLEAHSYHEWTLARPANDFSRVAPLLEKLVEMARQEAEMIGYEEHPYDALLEDYEPYGRLSQIKPLLLDLGEQLSGIIPTIISQQTPLPSLQGGYSEAQQHALCQRITSDIGYSFESGRLDKAPHPFETSLGPHDIRITTRYDEANYLSSLVTALHEAGHAIYEDGLLKRWKGTPMGSSISLGIHESQSRFYENILGRSMPFARYIYSVLQEFFPAEHASTSPEEIWAHTNHIAKSFIRVEADEVTYSLHVVIRMQLEVALVSGELEVKDLPAAWNELYAKYLGITPPSDREGVLQDVHWYGGSIGYFPTYALGNLYGAMMHEKMQQDIPGMESLIEQGDFRKIREWLNTNVHQYGKRFTGPDLIEHITGHELSVAPFVSYVRKKFPNAA